MTINENEILNNVIKNSKDDLKNQKIEFEQQKQMSFESKKYIANMQNELLNLEYKFNLTDNEIKENKYNTK